MYDGQGCTSCKKQPPTEDSSVNYKNLVRIAYETSFRQEVCVEELPTNCEEHDGKRCTKCNIDFGMVIENSVVKCKKNNFDICKTPVNFIDSSASTLEELNSKLHDKV